MTDNQINIAIAEACGWAEIDGLSAKGLMGKPPGKLCSFDYLPDYCNDLNAMHEAEKVLNSGQINTYLGHMYRNSKPASVGSNPWESVAVRVGVHATARQRAEAFLRTIGKWKESAK